MNFRDHSIVDGFVCGDDSGVRPDGRLSPQLVGGILASGLTAKELKANLLEQYDQELKNPEIALFLRSFSTNMDLEERLTGKARRGGA